MKAQLPRWTPDEDERLRKLAAEGQSAAAIAKRLKRAPGSIRGRAERLGIPLAKERTAPMTARRDDEAS